MEVEAVAAQVSSLSISQHPPSNSAESVTERNLPEAAHSPKHSTACSSSSGVPAPPAASTVGSAAASAQPQTPADTGSESYAALLAAAQRAAANKQHRSAATACASLLLLRPGHVATSVTLAKVLVAAGQPEAAVEVLQAAIKSRSSAPTSSGISSSGQGEAADVDLQLLQLLGESQVAAGQLEEALETFQQALGIVDDQDTQQQLQLEALGATALYPQGSIYAEAATQLVLSVLKQCKEQAVALRQYAVIAADKGLWGDVAKVAVRLLAKDPGDMQVQQLLAQAAQDAQGMQQLLSDVGSTPDSAAALAFLAHTVKEHGAVQQAVQLYRKAVQLQPGSSSYALGLAHALELEQDYVGVLEVVLGFCEANRNTKLGPLQLEEVLQLQATQMKQQPFQTTSTAWLNSCPWAPGPSLEDRQAAAAAAAAGGGGADDPSVVGSCMDDPAVISNWLPISNNTDIGSIARLQQPGVTTAVFGSSSSIRGSNSANAAYQPADLDTLALLFTAAKVLFCSGALTAAAQLLKLCDAARQASKQPLHCTHIRNEAAYAGCIMQLLWDCPPPPLAAAAAGGAAGDVPPLYLCGDSHTLSGAWRPITIAGQQHMLHPLLLTGLKIWHLRPESRYYPKYQFWRAVRALPAGSKLVLLLGEIDCREGLAVAVERMKYDSLVQAASATASIYMSVLLQLVEQHNLQIFVHPVPPVLDETRQIVKVFEAALRGAVQHVVSSHPEVKRKLVYLSFFDHLLTHSKTKLEPQLCFDGTHLNPRYLQHLEAALNVAVGS